LTSYITCSAAERSGVVRNDAEVKPAYLALDQRDDDTRLIQQSLFDARDKIREIAERLHLKPDSIHVNDVDGKFTDIYLISEKPLGDSEKDEKVYEQWVQSGLKLRDTKYVVKPHFAQVSAGTLIGVQVQQPLKELAEGIRAAKQK